MVEYSIKDMDDGELFILLGDFVVVKMYYSAKHCRSPFSKEEANKLAELFVPFLENSVDPKEVDEEEYTSNKKELFEAFLRAMVDCCE